MTDNRSPIKINARKFDGTIHRSWNARLIEQRDSLLAFVGVFENEVTHPQLGVIRRGTISYEYYWLDRWFNVFKFHEPEGHFRNFYCNVNLPPTFDGSTLDYVDLDLDLLVYSDGRQQILDLDEFDLNAVRFSYPEDVVVNARNAVRDLSGMIERQAFPFEHLK